MDWNLFQLHSAQSAVSHDPKSPAAHHTYSYYRLHRESVLLRDLHFQKDTELPAEPEVSFALPGFRYGSE